MVQTDIEGGIGTGRPGLKGITKHTGLRDSLQRVEVIREALITVVNHPNGMG